MNDVVRLACERAVRGFGGNDGMFNAAGFSNAMARLADCRGGLDGKMVRVILCGRSDVAVCSGGAHYRLKGAV